MNLKRPNCQRSSEVEVDGVPSVLMRERVSSYPAINSTFPTCNGKEQSYSVAMVTNYLLCQVTQPVYKADIIIFVDVRLVLRHLNEHVWV